MRHESPLNSGSQPFTSVELHNSNRSSISSNFNRETGEVERLIVNTQLTIVQTSVNVRINFKAFRIAASVPPGGRPTRRQRG